MGQLLLALCGMGCMWAGCGSGNPRTLWEGAERARGEVRRGASRTAARALAWTVVDLCLSLRAPDETQLPVFMRGGERPNEVESSKALG